MARLSYQHKLLIDLAKQGAELARVAMNAMPAADKRRYAKDMRKLSNDIQETIGKLYTATSA